CGLLVRPRGLIPATHGAAWSDVVRFAVLSLPAAFYRVRWWTVAAMVVFCVYGVATGLWAFGNPEALSQMGTPQEREQYASQAFEAYYSNFPAPDFAAQVWTNNAWIAARAIGGGITGVFPIWMLVQNAHGVGMAGAVMAEHGYREQFFGLILPHGRMELTAIFVAVRAGVKLCWAWIAPGTRTRSRALAADGRGLVSVAIGLVVVLGVSGLGEGLVPPSALPTGVKSAVGALVLPGHCTYTIVLDRQAVAAGETGEMHAEHPQ